MRSKTAPVAMIVALIMTLYGAAVAEAQGKPATPKQPKKLKATTLSSTSVELQWEDNSDDEDKFVIERSLTGSGGPFAVLDTLPPNTTSYGDIGLPQGVQHCYQVHAVGIGGPSADSNIVCSTTIVLPAAPPTLLQVVG